MAPCYDLLSNLDETSESQSYNIKVRVLKKWSITHWEHKYQKPMLEMVVIEGSRIQCSIRNPLRRYFEDQISEGKVFSINKFSLATNDQKYKSTTYACRIYFKRDTQINLVDDLKFPDNVFNFVPNEVILNHTNAQSHLIDVIGVLTGKGNTIEFTRNGKTCIYVVLELDDMKGNGKVRYTLWEEFAAKLVKHVEEQPTSEYVIIMQFAKFNMYKGVMGVSNTNYNSTLLINPDLAIAKEFRQIVMMSNIPAASMLLHISAEPPYSIEEDLLHNCVYKSVSQLKDAVESGTFATIGTVVGIDARSGWWYKSCKQCFSSLKENENCYHCHKCNTHPTSHVPRYSINLKVADETETASFVLYDKEATKFLGLSASDLRVSQLTRGGIKEEYPVEIGGFLHKPFIFKVSVKLEDMNAFQPCKIVVIKLCADPPLIAAFIEHHKQHVPSEISELLSPTTLSEVASKNESSNYSVGRSSEDGGKTFCTPKRALFTDGLAKVLAHEYPDSTEKSSSKTRKIELDNEENQVEINAA